MKGAEPVVLIRYSEIGVKLGRTRRYFEERLVRTIRCWLGWEGVAARARLVPGRVVLEGVGSLGEAARAAYAAARAFGVHSATPAYRIPNDLESLKRLVPLLFREALERAETFAVRARRVEAYPVKSREVERVVGAAVLEEVPGLRVDLEEPDVLIRLEIRSRRAYAYLDSWLVEGPGGLPYGVEGVAAIPLLECSLDELFAAWLAARRGARLTLLGCRRAAEALVEAWVPCGDATLLEPRDPLAEAARLYRRGAALPVYARVVKLPGGGYTLSPLEYAPRAPLERLRAMFEKGLRSRAQPALSSSLGSRGATTPP